MRQRSSPGSVGPSMASHAHHYLAIFDDDGRALYLGRTKRIATADQRIVLTAKEHGRTFPAAIDRHITAGHITWNEWAVGGNNRHRDPHAELRAA
ncbi:Conserved protein of uncharacterised function, possible maturase [Mycobacteroides abscessus subsp. massiliense]|nr:Conserved protein of uncharacterised function, possible maturase [Mycobacteroides abscessus subsp. massiliense]SKH68370.1 Conserved protein of uncharacterised function, possible maturase [Mycobacteroides abscessus subsp. massiliense]SKH79257.1 Conserved protein of uncharacterised function, possible maturase [Mycobacteroides abscessus subsp. massiliense]SKI51841.1 Conserved protein of uncharacterised function, possible maturase [Mycobacteroides abscessus subsp. massiliense]SKI56950.1 Conserve